MPDRSWKQLDAAGRSWKQLEALSTSGLDHDLFGILAIVRVGSLKGVTDARGKIGENRILQLSGWPYIRRYIKTPKAQTSTSSVYLPGMHLNAVLPFHGASLFPFKLLGTRVSLASELCCGASARSVPARPAQLLVALIALDLPPSKT